MNNNVIKIDGHIFVDKYKTVNTIEPFQATVAMSVGAFCKNCNYEIAHTIDFLKEQGIFYIFLHDLYLPCEQYQIKKLLE